MPQTLRQKIKQKQDDKNYLSTVDYYSGYFEVDQLHSKTGTHVIMKKLRDILSHMKQLMNC